MDTISEKLSALPDMAMDKDFADAINRIERDLPPKENHEENLQELRHLYSHTQTLAMIQKDVIQAYKKMVMEAQDYLFELSNDPHGYNLNIANRLNDILSPKLVEIAELL
jgi:hypothetical protein